ncbi:MAG: hypothetical protein ACRC2K_07435 [Clostridium sp.]
MINKLKEKFFMSDEDVERLAKCLATGVGVGVLIGVIFVEVELFFSLGGVVGIIASFFMKK